MHGFGVHTSMWTMNWDRAGAEKAIEAAVGYGMDFIEIALLNAPAVDAEHSRKLLERNSLPAVCSLGLPESAWASVRPEAAIKHLEVAIDKTADMGALALSGVIFGGIGERTGVPPTEKEYDNIARVLDSGREARQEARNRTRRRGGKPLRKPSDQHWGSSGLDDRESRRRQYIRPSRHVPHEHRREGRRQRHPGRTRTPEIHPPFGKRSRHAGQGNVPWDEVYAALAAINFRGGLAMESFINMPPEVSYGLSVWRPVAKDEVEVMGNGLPFLRNKARQYGLID